MSKTNPADHSKSQANTVKARRYAVAKTGTKRKATTSTISRPDKRARIADEGGDELGDQRDVDMQDETAVSAAQEKAEEPIMLQKDMPNEEKAFEELVANAVKSTGRVLRSATSKKTAEAHDKSDGLVDKGAGGGAKEPSGKGKGKAAHEGARGGRSKATGQPGKKKSTGKDTGKGVRKGKKDNEAPDESESNSDSESGPEPEQKTTTGFPIRRILGQRKNNKRPTEYLVEWYPRWQTKKFASGVDGAALQEWEEYKADHAIEFDGRTVYKTQNPTSDDSTEQVRLMLDAVLRMFRKNYVSRDSEDVAREILDDDEWIFHHARDRNLAARIARDNEHAIQNPTAAQVMRFTFDEMAGVPVVDPVTYRDVHVRFTGTIDPQAQPPIGQPTNGASPVDFLNPIFHHAFANSQYMKTENWTHPIDTDDEEGQAQVRWHVQVLQDAARDIVQHGPYLLQEPKALMFVSLFFSAFEIKDLIQESDMDFELRDEDGDPNRWEARARNVFIYTYLRENRWEMRAVDSVDTTFSFAQMFIDDEMSLAKEGVGSERGDSDDGRDGDEHPQRQSRGSETAGNARPIRKRKGSAADREGHVGAETGDEGGDDGDNGEGPSGTHEPKGRGKAKTKDTGNGQGPSGAQKKNDNKRAGGKATTKPGGKAGAKTSRKVKERAE